MSFDKPGVVSIEVYEQKGSDGTRHVEVPGNRVKVMDNGTLWIESYRDDLVSGPVLNAVYGAAPGEWVSFSLLPAPYGGKSKGKEEF